MSRLPHPAQRLLIDFPDFNLRLAEKLHRLGIPVFYFIAPQVWAWREGRVHTIRRTVRKLATIIPFEEEYFRNHGINAHYVGHPYLDRPPCVGSPEELRQSLGLPTGTPLLAMLPGSRQSEVQAHLPPLLEAFDKLHALNPTLIGAIPLTPSIDRLHVSALVGHRAICLIDGKSRELLHCATAAVVKSGSSTVEAALAQVPFIIIYKVSSLSYAIAKLLVRGVRSIGMVNLILKRPFIPELIQSKVTGTEIAEAVYPLLEHPELRAQVRAELALVGEQLRASLNPQRTAASRACDLLDEVCGLTCSAS